MKIYSEQFKKNRDKFMLDSSNYYLPADVKVKDPEGKTEELKNSTGHRRFRK